VQVVIFKLGNEQFALNTDKVQGINDAMEITKVPNAPGFIIGLMNLRGNVIALLDINILLDVPKASQNQDNIIIIDTENELLGIAVDQVEDVLDIDADIIEKPVDDFRKEYVEGIINFKDSIATLINIDKLLIN
jgi:purine-binding chemotaxis protein CheW